MTRPQRHLLLAGTLTAICALLAFNRTSVGDYSVDASIAVRALSHGHLGTYLSAKPLMGPLSPMVEAPFAAFAGNELSMYQWACLPCLLALAALGFYLATVVRKRGATELAQWLIAILCLVNPVTLEALRLGHPEELWTAALAIGAVVVAGEGHRWRAAILLGLAIASKQWAVMAIFPVLMVLPSRRVWTAAVAGGVTMLLYLPTLIASPASVWAVQSVAAAGGADVTVWSVWYPFSPTTVHTFAALHSTQTVYVLPTSIQPYVHTLVVALFIGIPLALWAWRRSFKLEVADGLALFALLALLRCVLDPNDNLYYHLPLLVSLFAWDAVSPWGRLPLRGLLGAACFFFFWRWSHELSGGFNLVYLLAVAGATAAIVASLVRRGVPAESGAGTFDPATVANA